MKTNRTALFLFIVGAIIFLYPHLAQHVNSEIQRSNVEQFKREREKLSTKTVRNEQSLARRCNEAIYNRGPSVADPFTEEFAQGNIEECKRVEEDYQTSMIATLDIPKLNIEIPIFIGATEEKLKRGVSQVDGSSLPVGGNNTHTVLAGHRGMGTKAMFRHLDELTRGDMFYIYTKNKKLTYEVYEVDVILPDETENLHVVTNKDLASLITCHPYRHNSHRLVIHGERITD